MLATTRNKLVAAGIVLVLALWIGLVFIISPEEIVSAIGVQNTYLVVFLLATIGGLSTVTGTSLFAALATFASGGADPWLLGLVGGLGIFISDSVFFLVAHHGARALPKKPNGIRDRLAHTFKRIPQWALAGGVYAYVGITPLPNDILMGALALARIPYRSIVVPLLAGSITIALLTAHIGESFPW